MNNATDTRPFTPIYPLANACRPGPTRRPSDTPAPPYSHLSARTRPRSGRVHNHPTRPPGTQSVHPIPPLRTQRVHPNPAFPARNPCIPPGFPAREACIHTSQETK
jgi:hypothetical protein